MNPWAQIRHENPGRFHVGERVRIAVGFAGAEAEILEDHGPLGVGGRRFYTIRMHVPQSEDVVVDYPEDEMEPLSPRAVDGLPSS